MKVTLKPSEIDGLRAARWKARTDLLYLCNHVLGYVGIEREVHGPIIDKLQQFQAPTDLEYVENDQYDPKQRTWIYRPVIAHQDLPGPRFFLLLDGRGHGKTTLGVIAHGVQYIINYPNITILIVVANEDRAATIVSEIANHFKSNEVFRRLFPEHCPAYEQLKSWGNMSGFTSEARDFSYEASKVKRETTVYVGSIEAGVASRHFDVIKCSDIVDDKNSETREQCAKITHRFGLLGPVVVNERSWVYVEGTRYHAEDTYGTILEGDAERIAQGRKQKYEVFFRSCFKRKDPTFTLDDLTKPFVLDEQGRKIPVFPYNPRTKLGFSYETLEEKRLDPIDGPHFACQYLNDPTPAETAALPVDIEHNLPGTVDPDIFKATIKISYRDMAVDFAYSQTARADFTAISVCAWDFANRPYIEDIQHGKWPLDGAAGSIRRLLDAYIKYKPRHVYIEDTPFTRGLEPTLAKTFQTFKLYPNWVWIRRPGAQRKTQRIEAALSMWWKSRGLKFVHHADRPMSAWAALCREAMAFPKGKHDDILDTLADLFHEKEYFGRLGPRDIDDPDVKKTHWERWRDSEQGQKAQAEFLHGPSVELPEWTRFGSFG